MIKLSKIPLLRNRCVALAALDLILSPDWELRYFSFNSAWAEGQQMASMRNGSGGEWFCLFHSMGWAGLKGFCKGSQAWHAGGERLARALCLAVPPEMADFSSEPAFRWDETTYVFCCLGAERPWARLIETTSFVGLATGEEEHLSLVVGQPSDYVKYARDYFELNIPLRAVEMIYAGHEIDKNLALRLNSEVVWDDIRGELFDEIGYPTGGGWA